KAHTNFRRDFAIVGAVGELVACGLSATRNEATHNNDGSERECACSIVAGLLEELGVKLSDGAVAKVWAKRAYLYPHLRGAAFRVEKIEPNRAALLSASCARSWHRTGATGCSPCSIWRKRQTRVWKTTQMTVDQIREHNKRFEGASGYGPLPT